MDTNEIMVNEDVIKTTEEIAKAGSNSEQFWNGFKLSAGIWSAVLVGFAAYKYVTKKQKEQKEQNEQKEQHKMDNEFDEVDDTEIDE